MCLRHRGKVHLRETIQIESWDQRPHGGGGLFSGEFPDIRCLNLGFFVVFVRGGRWESCSKRPNGGVFISGKVWTLSQLSIWTASLKTPPAREARGQKDFAILDISIYSARGGVWRPELPPQLRKLRNLEN